MMFLDAGAGWGEAILLTGEWYYACSIIKGLMEKSTCQRRFSLHEKLSMASDSAFHVSGRKKAAHDEFGLSTTSAWQVAGRTDAPMFRHGDDCFQQCLQDVVVQFCWKQLASMLPLEKFCYG